MLTCTVNSCYVLYCIIHIQNPVYHHKFGHIQAYLRSIQTYSAILWHIYNSVELWHIQNPAIFKILAYLEPKTYLNSRTLSRHIVVYSKRCVTLACWEPYHIQNFVIFSISAYLEHEVTCLYIHIQAYLGIFNNDSYNNINFKHKCFRLQWQQF